MRRNDRDIYGLARSVEGMLNVEADDDRDADLFLHEDGLVEAAVESAAGADAWARDVRRTIELRDTGLGM